MEDLVDATKEQRRVVLMRTEYLQIITKKAETRAICSCRRSKSLHDTRLLSQRSCDNSETINERLAAQHDSSREVSFLAKSGYSLTCWYSIVGGRAEDEADRQSNVSFLLDIFVIIMPSHIGVPVYTIRRERCHDKILAWLRLQLVYFTTLRTFPSATTRHG